MTLMRSVSSWVRRRARASEAVLIGLAVVVGGVAGLLSVVQGAIARTLQHWLFALPNGGRLSAADHLAPLALLALPLGGLALVGFSWATRAQPADDRRGRGECAAWRADVVDR